MRSDLTGGVTGQESGKQCKAVPTLRKQADSVHTELACFVLVGALPQSPQNTKLVFWNAGFVLADCVSFASPQAARLSHFIARPLPTKPRLCGDPFHRLRDFANRLWAGGSALLRLFFPSFIRFLLLLVQLQNTVDIGLGRQQLFHFLAGFSVVGVGRFLRKNGVI